MLLTALLDASGKLSRPRWRAAAPGLPRPGGGALPFSVLGSTQCWQCLCLFPEEPFVLRRRGGTLQTRDLSRQHHDFLRLGPGLCGVEACTGKNQARVGVWGSRGILQLPRGVILGQTRPA